ncbi:DUF4231 domain-containing protein [Cylindrospermopsis raciborskii]|uniref:DUF4231 domain-containing protein n=1 Tax=Cylindrospermopsis raciborskii CENA302 TaxID=1170768 RepID=A0A9Q5W961_9CYAN|nr:DUF4231 domain-containing protein [Cylindrospermopsis raciborskii]MCZ2202211.1 DUF4231 domain-containing protein [Cylindrospermopsis raciborskii PAMP2012]MCZ2204845.1 DUF4231 domain-containing protein [Cylindrospermopsis raciborskii PAMP2011]NLQ05048.1 DUF4231 domain-containing protein [Cylindrospermopsis raciborskii MVCC19]OHY35160.1 hypothetical protein BCV64_02035 [Cylindrospermopsis raciborskii MVCC14]OPH09644.1 hypothetical protein CENA302_09370 [Cylindrospermopsis raciborskii CENA302]
MLLFLKLIDYLLAAVFIGAALIIYFDSNNQPYLLAGIGASAIAILLFLINRNSVGAAEKQAKKNEFTKKAELYTSLLQNSNSLENNTIVPARAKALEYCQDLINDYKKTRNIARSLYYFLQISTVILSGVTPILVLVDKLETGQPWLKWLPVICPAVASIVASIVTSFPFQKNWVTANTIVELLEAEQEKFILGITPAYRCYDVVGDLEQQQKASQAVELFISQVNSIHLQQVQQATEQQSDKRKEETKTQDPALN